MTKERVTRIEPILSQEDSKPAYSVRVLLFRVDMDTRELHHKAKLYNLPSVYQTLFVAKLPGACGSVCSNVQNIVHNLNGVNTTLMWNSPVVLFCFLLVDDHVPSSCLPMHLNHNEEAVKRKSRG